MTRSLAVLTLLAVTLPAGAHFIWLAPHEGKVRMVFSDDTSPDAGVAITKVAQAQVHIRTSSKPVAAEKTPAEDCYLIALPNPGPAEVGAVCEYGILEKGAEPFLLCYYAKALIGKQSPSALGHPLEIFPVEGKARVFEVRWQGKAAAGLEVVVEDPDQGALKHKTDAQGQVTVASAPKTGPIALRAKYVEAKAGERAGKAFREVRHYATLTVPAR